MLNIYDLSQGLARQLSTTFLGKAIEGIWHTGIVVYGKEYYFGGGIQQDPVGKTPYGTPIRVVELGVTHVPQDVFETYLKEISPRYRAETYSLLTHNCNNFTNEVAQFLVGVTIPDYILQLPNEVLNSPMGALILPMIQQLEATLRSNAVPQPPQFKPLSATVNASINMSSSSTPNNATEVKAIKEVAEIKTSGKLAQPAKKHESSNKEQENKGSTVSTATEDPLGEARSKVQEEIGREFAAIMATGTLRASEAAALATRRVMERYGHMDVAMQQS